jgi:hypothetical protein
MVGLVAEERVALDDRKLQPIRVERASQEATSHTCFRHRSAAARRQPDGKGVVGRLAMAGVGVAVEQFELHEWVDPGRIRLFAGPAPDNPGGQNR